MVVAAAIFIDKHVAYIAGNNFIYKDHFPVGGFAYPHAFGAGIVYGDTFKDKIFLSFWHGAKVGNYGKYWWE